jgi:hypothetical protein
MDGSFDERLQSMHVHLKRHFSKLGQVSVAIYDQRTDLLKTFASSSTEGHSPFLQYEVKLSDVPSLRQGGSALCLIFNQRITVPDNHRPSPLFSTCFAGLAHHIDSE